MRLLRRHVVIFGSCQGLALAKLVRPALPRHRYRLFFFWNPAGAGEMRPAEEVLEALSSADYAIYQPLGEAHGELAAEPVARVVESVPEVARFPRIINPAAQSLSRANRRSPELVFGQAYVNELLDAGVGVEEVKRRFAAGEIDFELPRRYAEALARLAHQEQARECNARVSEFILGEGRRRRMFLTHNHPTTTLVAELAAQVAAATGLPIDVGSIRELAERDPNAAGLPLGSASLTPADVAALGYEFGPSPDWREVGERLIDEIASERAATPPAPAPG